MIQYCILLLTTVGIGAASNFNSDDTARNSPYLYSEIQSLDFDIIYEDGDTTSSSNPIIDETRRNPLDNRKSQDHQQTPYEYRSSSYDLSLSEFDTDDFEDQGASPSIVASSVLYDGDCYVSSEAMMCHGGGGDNMMDGFINYDDLFEDDDGEPTDEDDDDDDNDGHSSMLSTASLLRSKSTTRRKKTGCHASSEGKSSDTQETTYMNKLVRFNNVLQLQSCRIQQQDRQQRTESFAFLREHVFAVARGASKTSKQT